MRHRPLTLGALATIVATIAVPLSAQSRPGVPRSAFGRVPAPPGIQPLLTPPERATAPVPTFSAWMAEERPLPLTPGRAIRLSFDARLAPLPSTNLVEPAPAKQPAAPACPSAAREPPPSGKDDAR